MARSWWRLPVCQRLGFVVDERHDDHGTETRRIVLESRIACRVMHRSWTDVRGRALWFWPRDVGGLGRAKTIVGRVGHCIHVGERLLFPRRCDSFEEMIVVSGRTITVTGETFAFGAAQFTFEVVEFSSFSLVRVRFRWKIAVQTQ